MTFGILSSVFDYLTFGALLFIFHGTEVLFRTAWFVESVVSASIIVLVIRTQKPFFKSKPGRYLLMTTLLIGIVTILLPFSPLAGLLGFQPLPVTVLLVIGVIVAFYVVAAEVTKRFFYQMVKF